MVVAITVAVTITVSRILAQVADPVPSQPEVAESASMPTREEKSREAQVWRVTLQGKPAANRCACKKLEAAAQKTKRRKCAAIVSVDMAEEDVIMLCFVHA